MHAMQYEIKLPSNYDMEVIKERVKLNGYRTNGFNDLLIKAYLIKQCDEINITNVYSPLYIWKSSQGMTNFVFNGYYDNILTSFGWQEINIGVPFLVDIDENVKQSKYVIEEYVDINPTFSLANLEIKSEFICFDNKLAEIIIYNPEKWKFVKFSFVDKFPLYMDKKLEYYEILHISQ